MGVIWAFGHLRHGIEGKLCAGKITPELRARYDALPSTSTSVERLHAIGRRVDDCSGGVQRYENRAGVSLAMYNHQAAYLLQKPEAVLERQLAVARRAARTARKKTQQQQRVAAGRAKQEGRNQKMSSKRGRREKKQAEKVRIEGLELATRYSALIKMSVDDLKDQLKGYRLQGKAGFPLAYPKRADYVLQAQTLMFDAIGAGANDLKDGDSGVEGRGVRKRKVASPDDVSGAAGKARGKASKSRRKVLEYNGYQWYEEEEFVMQKLIGKMVAEGDVPGRSNVKKGTVLYKVLWEGFPPEVATWEEERGIHDELIDAFEDAMDAEEEEEGAEESEESEAGEADDTRCE